MLYKSFKGLPEERKPLKPNMAKPELSEKVKDNCLKTLLWIRP
jgi:hypothetical protein